VGKHKLQRFKENKSFPHVIQPHHPELLNNQVKIKGRWNKTLFKNDNPLVLELGCGKGEYAVGLAKLNQDKNYIGVDIKGARLWRGAKDSLEAGMLNVAFLRIRIDFIQYCFARNEVDEIWCPFSDPHRGRRKSITKRLTSSKFLKRYQAILKNNGIIHLKTDDPVMYAYTLDVIRHNKLPLLHDIPDIYDGDHTDIVPPIKTHYEYKWLEEKRTIRYIRFRLLQDIELTEPPIGDFY
jgi:tRNA (guanine-N7-)-methyltransferase